MAKTSPDQYSYSSPVSPGPLLDKPVQPFNNFNGYFHKKDRTLLPLNVLTFPTINVFMPDGDKIVPRLGEKIFEQDNERQNSGMIGHFKKYKNVAGVEMEMRVWNDNSMTLTGISGVFSPGANITGASSGATAQIDKVQGSKITFSNLVGTFTGGETVNSIGGLGVISVYKGDVIEVSIDDVFVQITPNINTLEKGVNNLPDELSTLIYYFDQWVDTNLDPSLSINTNRAIWVMGLNKIRSWTGGIANIGTIVVNTSIETEDGLTWASKGFPSPANGGSNKIVVNGVSYTITGGWDTDTLTLSSTSGMTSGDLAFSGIQEITPSTLTNFTFDVISCFKNYPCYGDWNLQKFAMANNFNRPASESITSSQAVQNDLVLDDSPYTGSGRHVYRVTIDSVNPNIEEQTFYGGGLNDAQFNTSAYSGTPGATNFYNINYLADFLLLVPTAGGAWANGETVTGGTSNAQGIVVTSFIVGGNTTYGIKMVTGNGFKNGENITGSATVAIVKVPTQAQFQDWIQYSKNNVVVNIDSGSGSMAIAPLQSASPITLSDGLTIRFGNFQGHTPGDSIQLIKNDGGADTFQWQIDGATPVATFVPITGSSQSLSDGISITFTSPTGHAVGDYWDITVDQNIGGNTDNAYANFYYGIPRKPGEGYIGQLPANFWAMKPQEGNMYINDASGKWGYLETKLSADLQSETIEYVPLKQASRNKVLYPYLLGYKDNDIAYITEDKNLDFIGRKELIELPQVSHLSDPVRFDFLAASFRNGTMEFNSLRLYITSPENLLMFCWDVSQNYWQPPQLIPENCILSEIGQNLISHSNIRNITNTLFVNKNDNGSAFPIRIRTGYHTFGERWQKDKASMMFIEGYMDGNPSLTARVFQDVNGCSGIVQSLVEPVYCRVSDQAPLGFGSYGSHSYGSDEGGELIPYFWWIGVGQSPFEFYMAALDLECNSKDPTFEIVSMGLNAVAAETNNSKLKKGQLQLI